MIARGPVTLLHLNGTAYGRQTTRNSPLRFAALAVAVIVAIALVARWRFLDSSPYPFGIDGFYYATQLRSLLSDGRLYYPASPMAFWLMWPAAWAFGPIAGAKLGAALGTALAAVPVYAIARRATGERAAGVVGAALVATAAGSFHLATEFIKQAIGLTLALAFVATFAAVLDAPAGRGRRARVAFAAALFIAALLSHPTSGALAVAFIIPPLWVRATRGGTAHRLRTTSLIAAGAVAIAAVVMLLVPAVHRGMGLAGLFGPASFDFFGRRTFHHEVPLGALAAMALVVLHRVPRQEPNPGNATPSAESRALLVGPALMALVLALPWLSVNDPAGLVFRLRIMAFVPLAICAPAAMMQLLAWARPRVRQLVPIAAAVAVMGFVPLRHEGPVNRPNPAFVQRAAGIARHTPPDAIIVVRGRQLAFIVKWVADREARTTPPRPDVPRPTFRLASPDVLPPGVLGQLDVFEQRLPTHLPRPIRLGSAKPITVILFAEPTWQALLQAVSPADRAELEPWQRGH